MHRHLGVNHFYIYGLEDISEKVHRVLEYYTSIGVVTVFPWNLPVKNSPVFEKPADIAIHGQYSLINDCVYKSINRHRYILNHDLDEYIIPRDPTVKTTRALIEQIQNDKSFNKTLKYGAYGFLNCYYCLNSSDYANLGPQLVTLKRKTRHICLLHELEESWWKDNEQPHIEGGRGTAMKVIVYPARVILMGVHGVTIPIPGYMRDWIVGTHIGTLQHYKKPYKLGCDTHDSTLVDKFKDVLLYRVNYVCKEAGIAAIPAV